MEKNEEYKPNSHKSKEEQPEEKRVIEPVVTGARTKNRSGLRKFTDVFVPDDVSNVKSYILFDVLVPAIKKAISDIVTNGVDMLLYGETRNKKNGGKASKIAYSSYFDRPSDDRLPSRRYMSSFTNVNIVVDSRRDAEDILKRMSEIIDTYEWASLADLYDLAGLDHNHTDNKYGWTSVANAQVKRGRDGWEIIMPKSMPID